MNRQIHSQKNKRDKAYNSTNTKVNKLIQTFAELVVTQLISWYMQTQSRITVAPHK